MKIRHLFSAALASALLIAGCTKPVDLGPAEVSILSPAESSIEVPMEGTEFTVTLKATIDWALQGYDSEVSSWILVTPESGKAAAEEQVITVKVLANDDIDRSADLVFYGNVLCKAPLTITQKGAKGDGSNISIAEFLERKDTEKEYILTGVIGDISNGEKYWGFSLKDETGVVSCPFPENFTEYSASLHTGDQVSIKGKYSYYESKQQDQCANGLIQSHTPASLDNIQTVTVAQFLEKADKFSMYRMVGEVSGSVNASYCAFDLKDETGSVYVYSVNNASDYGSKLKAGDKVTLRGAYTYFANGGKHEVVDCTIESYEEGQSGGGDTPGGPGELTKVTIAEFLQKSVNTTDWYQLTGTIVSIASTTYGNFTIKDDSGEVYVYGLTKEYVDKNDKSFSSIGLKVGDIVTLGTLRAEHNGSPQAGGTPPAFYISHEQGETPTYPKGSVVLAFPDDNSANNKVNDYMSTWDAKSGDNTFKMVNFNNHQWNGWSYIRCGRKNADSVASILTTTPIAAKLAKVVLKLDTVTASDLNYIKLAVYSDAACEKQVGADIAPDAIAAGDVNFVIPTETAAENLYYMLTFDCKTSASSKNGFVQVNSVIYFAAE